MDSCHYVRNPSLIFQSNHEYWNVGTQHSVRLCIQEIHLSISLRTQYMQELIKLLLEVKLQIENIINRIISILCNTPFYYMT